MTDTNGAASAGELTSGSRQDGQRGRGRGRNRGGGGSSYEGRENRPTGNRGGRRGGRGGNRGISSGPANGPSLPGMSSEQKKSIPKFEEREKTEGEGEGEEEAEVCFICASPVVHSAIAPCNHSTCHICALRMRALYKTRDCAHCRVSLPYILSIKAYANFGKTPAPFVIFTDEPTKRFEDFVDAELFADVSIGIKYESEDIQMDTRILLRYNCPDGDCDVACLSWPDLHRHVRTVHQKKICDLCSRMKKVFTHEHVLYTDKELHKHIKTGDDNPGAVDQSGFKGHPECTFCRQNFYGDDELYVHCRESHERCFICDRREAQPQYYLNYETLQLHFRKDHFMCPEPSCMEKRFIVFPTEIDLKAHQLEEHGNTLSKDVRRDARTINIASLDYRAPYVQERRGGGNQREQREGRGRGRGRDPNTEPLPASSAQPLRRDEQAFQRQMAVQGAQSSTTRSFGGQLTSTSPPARPQAQAGTREPPTMAVPRPANVEVAAAALQNLDISQAEMTPQDHARQVRHRSVIERASILLQNDQPKLTQFRNLISSFKSSAITGANLISSFFTLFESTSSNALGTLIREVADLYEDKAKSDSLVAAWNDWRAINEDYPTLPGLGMTNERIPLGWANKSSSKSSTKKVLNIKNSTAQSSRAPVSQSRSWGTASGLASSANPFPGLPPPSSSSSASVRQPTGRITTVPWVPPTSGPNSNPSSTSTNMPSSTASGKGKGKAVEQAFPALPPAPKPLSSIHTYGSGRLVRRDAGQDNSTSFTWGANGGVKQDPSADSEAVEDNGKGKKKQGKKVVLMGWG
jgi:hypothetical protein